MSTRTTLARLRRDSSGARLERRLLAGFGSTVLVLIVAAFSFGEFSRSQASKLWVEHTLDVIVALKEVQTALAEAESAQRGYLLTSDETYRAPYRDAVARLAPALALARALTTDNGEQQRRCDALARAVAERLAALDETVHRHDVADHTGVIELLRTGRGRRAMAEVQRILIEMTGVEDNLLKTREREHDRDVRATAWVIGAGSLGAFLLGIAANIGIRNGVHERQRHQTLIETQAARLEAQAQALKKANEELDQFAYAASHDLKAPLRGIANLSEWIEEDVGGELPPKSRDHLQLLRGRVRRLEALIDGILAYSRVSRFKDKPEPIETAAILREVIELLAPPPGVVTIEAPETMPRLTLQKAPFQQLWMNLIGNALKHAGGPDTSVRLAAKDAGSAWEFSVSDNGPGIELQYQERIFRIFHTLASRDKVEGTGIGLAIVKKVVEDKGGKVWVESEPGRGATFRFTWPK